MPLETGDYINDLNPSNPSAADPKSEGDDHLRLVKETVKNTFPGFTGTIIVGGNDAGSAVAYSLTPATPLLAYSENMVVAFKAANTNTGANPTLNISGLGPKTIKDMNGLDILPGDIQSNRYTTVVYDGTNFNLLGVTKNFVEQQAFNAALPAQTGNAGKFLTTNGLTSSWGDSFGVAVNEAKAADIASAATINLTTATGNLVHITGTTTITAITIPSGAERTVVFDGVLTLTHSANLVLPTGANITTAVGDSMKVRGDGSAARVVSYSRSNGRALSSSLVLLAGPLVPTAALSIDFLNVFNSSYDEYIVQLNGLKNGLGGTKILFRFAIGGVVDSASNYAYSQLDDPALGAGGVTSIPVSALSVANRPVTSTIKITSANSTDAGIKTVGTISIIGAAPGVLPVSFGSVGYHDPGNVATGFRILWDAGVNFTAAGNVKVYGVSKS